MNTSFIGGKPTELPKNICKNVCKVLILSAFEQFLMVFNNFKIECTKKALRQVIGQNVTLRFMVCQFEDFHEKNQL